MTLERLTDDGQIATYLTYQELADRWQCSKATIRRRIHAGQLDVVVFSISFKRITGASVLRYEREHLRGAA